MKITYKGKTTKLSNALLDAPKVTLNRPRKSTKFDEISVCYDGVYYFTKGLKKSNKRENKPYQVEGVYYRGKWHQDTFYITEELKNILTFL